MMKIKIGLTLLAVALLAFVFPQNKPTFGQTPVELGLVTWNRDLDEAKAISARTGKPLFVQFQEVPG